jgi:hypothetical protein
MGAALQEGCYAACGMTFLWTQLPAMMVRHFGSLRRCWGPELPRSTRGDRRHSACARLTASRSDARQLTRREFSLWNVEADSPEQGRETATAKLHMVKLHGISAEPGRQRLPLRLVVVTRLDNQSDRTSFNSCGYLWFTRASESILTDRSLRTRRCDSLVVVRSCWSLWHE